MPLSVVSLTPFLFNVLTFSQAAAEKKAAEEKKAEAPAPGKGAIDILILFSCCM